MNKQEWYTAGSLSAVYAVRMLGLFMILPVFALYSESLADATPVLIGVAIGIYGLTQATFQIPLGLLSDKIGRKPVIAGGLLVFALGSVIAASTDNIWIIIIGRAIQGMGAVAAATMALAADLTREQNRAKVMSVIGMTIGMSFMLAMIIGPLINEWVGISGIFWFTAALSVAGVLLILFVVPQPQRLASHRDVGINKSYLGATLRNKSLWRMNIGVFILHMIMTANFSVLPLIFQDSMGLDGTDHWKIYLPVFFGAAIFSIPLIIIAEKYHKIRSLFLIAILAIIIAQFGMAFGRADSIVLMLMFFSFAIGFNFLEAVQPSLVSKYSDVNIKGTAMGVFSTFQFSGIFVGGLLGGLVQSEYGYTGVFLLGAGMAWIWIFVALTLPKPNFYTSRILELAKESVQNVDALEVEISEVVGVKEVSISTEEGVAYLKVDKKELDEEALLAFSNVSTPVSLTVTR